MPAISSCIKTMLTRPLTDGRPVFDDEMCALAVKRVAHREKFFQTRFGVFGLQQRAILVAPACAAIDRADWRANRRPRPLFCSAWRFSGRKMAPAAGGQHNIPLTGEVGNDLRFAFSKARFALELENNRNARTRARLGDFVV